MKKGTKPEGESQGIIINPSKVNVKIPVQKISFEIRVYKKIRRGGAKFKLKKGPESHAQAIYKCTEAM